MAVAASTTPVLLMVSGGSDSTALLELAASYVRAGDDGAGDDALIGMLAAALPRRCELAVLHVNHMLRGADADDDEAFVVRRCEELGIPCTVRRIDVAALPQAHENGIEAAARAARYRAADEVLDAWCAKCGQEARDGIVCTAHTLDDRAETFFMRALVGTGPGGLASIPRVRGRVRRPLLDATREQLRAWLRAAHPGCSDDALWREDATNDDGSNFRSQVRTQLIPAARELRPGFERSLARSMDLMADENEGLAQLAESIAYRNLEFDGSGARIKVAALAEQPRFIARRVLRACLLAVAPDARIESVQIERVLDGMGSEGFVTEVSGGIRVAREGDGLRLVVAQ